LTTEWHTVLGGTITASRQWPTITLAVVEIVIDMAVKTASSAIPRPCADEYSPGKPLRPIIAVRCAVVRRHLVESVRTNGVGPKAYSNLCSRITASGNEKTETNRENAKPCRYLHSSSSA
jgi:hypothetical protein